MFPGCDQTLNLPIDDDRIAWKWEQFNPSGRYIAENEGGNGIAKFIFDKKYRTMVGAHIMSNYSSEFIVACGIMIEQEMTIDAIREIVYPHPSVSEIIREAAFAVKL